jgi:hypothetical protein
MSWVLNFFKKINGFIKYPKANKTCQEKNECIHIIIFFSLHRETKTGAGRRPVKSIVFNVFTCSELRLTGCLSATESDIKNHINLKGYLSN